MRNPNPDAGPPGLYASGRTLKLFPAGDLFPIYVADPHRPTNTILVDFTTRVGIEDTRSPRFGLSAGGRFGMLRIDPPTPGGRSWQISVDAGLDALLTRRTARTRLGGTATMASPWRRHPGDRWPSRSAFCTRRPIWAMNTRTVRDDSATTTPVKRRQWASARGWASVADVRAETGVGLPRRYEQQEPWRVQGGVEYQSPQRLWGDRFHGSRRPPCRLWQERDWRLDTSFQAVSPRTPKGERIGSASRCTTGVPPSAISSSIPRHLSPSASGSISSCQSWTLTGVGADSSALSDERTSAGDSRRNQHHQAGDGHRRRASSAPAGAAVLGFVGWWCTPNPLRSRRPDRQPERVPATVENTRSAPGQRPRAWSGFPAASSRWAPPNRPA